MKLTRRGFVKFSAGSVMGLGVSGLSMKALSEITAATTEEIYPPRGPETFVNSICQLCPGGCGMTVRKIGERAVRIQGNKASPVSRGGLCPIGVASLQYLYHPERLRWPLKKEGNVWKRISWEQAIQEVTSYLQSLIGKGESERVTLLTHPLTGVSRQIIRWFLQGLGSHNEIQLSGPGDGNEVAVRLLQGTRGSPAYDLARSNHILSVGCEILEGWASPVWAMRGFSQFRGKRPRGRLTYAGPRQSVTAAKADTWIRLRPGTEGLFALGIAYVLISERLCDFEFLQSQCHGFEDWIDAGGKSHLGFRNFVLEHYPLNRVSEHTGVPSENILRAAREFGAARPALALAGAVEPVTPNQVLSALYIHSLNALVGSIDREGGVLLQYPDPLDRDEEEPEWFSPVLAASREQLHLGEDPLQAFERVLKGKQPYLPSAVVLLETDPVYDSPNGDELARLLEEIPFIVSISPFLNSSSQLADYVLPAAGFLESVVEQGAAPGAPFAYQGFAEPVIEPVGESRGSTDIILTLARSLGFKVPEEDYASLVKARLLRLYDLKRGAVAGTVFDQLWHQLMEQSGWWAPTYESPEQLLGQMATKGGWWDSFYRYEDWNRTLRSPSRKFQFRVEELPEPKPLKTAGDPYPFQVHFFEPLAAKSRQPQLPLVREISGGHIQNKGGLWFEIGPEDASHLHIRSGDLMWLESPQGRVQAFARVNPSVPDGTINLPKGLIALADPWKIAPNSGATKLAQSAPGGSAVLGQETRARVVHT